MDQAYLPLQYESGNPLVSNGVFPFSEPVLVSYMDLDMLIEAAPLAKSERKVLAWTMRGHSLDDIGERYGCAASTVLAKLKSAVDRMQSKKFRYTLSRGGLLFEPF